MKRSMWKLGKVEELVVGKDSVVRGAVIRISSVHSSTDFAPSQMVLGSYSKLPVDLLITNDVKDLQDKPKNPGQRQAQQFVSQLEKEVKHTFVQAQASLNNSRNKMKAQYDKKMMTSHQFSVSDYVMLWYPYKVPGLSRTWQPNSKGPFRFIARWVTATVS